MNYLSWILFIGLQVFQAGNGNYQQEMGYYEANDLYGKHPSKETIYLIKAAEIGVMYGLTKLFPEYENELLLGGSLAIIGCIIYDTQQGVALRVRF